MENLKLMLECFTHDLKMIEDLEHTEKSLMDHYSNLNNAEIKKIHTEYFGKRYNYYCIYDVAQCKAYYIKDNLKFISELEKHVDFTVFNIVVNEDGEILSDELNPDFEHSLFSSKYEKLNWNCYENIKKINNNQNVKCIANMLDIIDSYNGSEKITYEIIVTINHILNMKINKKGVYEYENK